MKLLVLGAGYSGSAILTEVIGCSETAGTTRSEKRFSRIAATGAKPFLYDGGGFSDELAAFADQTTHLVMSIAPDATASESADPLLADIGSDLARVFPNLRWAGYLSTVGVYGDHGGQWVDELTDCKPVSRRSIARLVAEQAWQSACEKAEIPLAILRLSGIYGPGRNAFVNLAEGKARRLIKPGQVFNRIRVEDIAGATAHLMLAEQGGIFNVTDDLPCPPQDVVEEAARLMGIEPPPEADFETADLSPMARSFYGENKRVANERIKAQGYDFRFPDYVSSLAELWNTGRWRG